MISKFESALVRIVAVEEQAAQAVEEACHAQDSLRCYISISIRGNCPTG
jgi:hypothetical protein